MNSGDPTSTIAEVDLDTGRLVVPPRQPDGWVVRYGERLQHKALVLDRAAAERQAVSLHGQIGALYEGPMP